MSIHFKTGVKGIMTVQWKFVPGQEGVQEGKSNHTGTGQAYDLIGQSNSHSEIQHQWAKERHMPQMEREG